MIRHFFMRYTAKACLIFALTVLLVGCEKQASNLQPARPKGTSTALPTFPAPTQAKAPPERVQPADPTPGFSKSALSTRAAISTAFAKTPTEVYSSPTPYLSPTPLPAAQPFHDCARTPGLVGCDPSAPGLAGHVAFYDAESRRLVGLDLKTGQGWAVPVPQPMALEWSPDGSQLLVRMNFPNGEPEPYEYLLFEKGGKLVRQFTENKNLYWQPQGAELRTYDERKIVRSQHGGEAWLGGSVEGKTLHFRTSGTADWKTAVLDIRPMEFHTEVYGWIPGTPNILIVQVSGISTVSWVTTGHKFYIFNTETGMQGYLRDFHTHPETQFMTSRGTDLAIIQLNMGLADDRLAILNGKTGDISHPFPRVEGEIQPYSLWQIAWQPGPEAREGLFVMMVRMLRTNLSNPPSPIPMFPKDGIYLYSRSSDQAQLVRETPEDIMGGNFHWTADGQYLIYGLGPFESPEGSQTSLFARQMKTGKEWLLLDHLVNPELKLSYFSWNLIAVSME